jgi:hypothetical protein
VFAVIKRILAVLRIQNVSWSRVSALLTHVEKSNADVRVIAFQIQENKRRGVGEVGIGNSLSK